MEKILKSVRFDEENLSIVEKIGFNASGEDFSGKLNDFISVFGSVIRCSKIELLNHFEENEAVLMVNALLGKKYTSNIDPKGFLLRNLEDSISIDNLDVKHKIDGNVILKKIESLTQFQSLVVLINCFEFLKSSNADNNEDNNLLRSIFLIK